MIIDRTNEYLERLERSAMEQSRLEQAKYTINAFAGRDLFTDMTDRRVKTAMEKLQAWSERVANGPSSSYPWPWLVN